MKRFTRLAVMVCSLALSSSLTACATQSAATAPLANPRTMTFAPLHFSIPTSERIALKNGMVVYLLQDHELPIVNMTALVRTGNIYEPSDKIGLAGLTGATLRSGGTVSTPADQLDRELEFMASSIESVINSDAGSVSLSTLTKNLDRTLELYAQVLMHPGFDKGRVELARNQIIEGIRRQNDDPKEVAARELKKVIYQGHPLGRFATISSMKRITREDLLQFHQRYFHPQNIILSVSGDFDRERLMARLEQLFGGWPNEPTDYPVVNEPKEDPKPEILEVQKEVNQSVIRMGHLGVDKDNPDVYALRVMDYILGGGFTSRLTQEIRSNQGLAYNVESYFDIGRRFKGSFVAETETKSESTAKVIGLMEKIMAGMTEAPVTDSELALAKDAIINSFIFGFTRSDAIVNQQARLEYYNYPAGYLENYRGNIAKVTKDDVLRVARKHLKPESMKLVVVGDVKKFDQPLSSFGSVRQITLNGNNK